MMKEVLTDRLDSSQLVFVPAKVEPETTGKRIDALDARGVESHGKAIKLSSANVYVKHMTGQQ